MNTAAPTSLFALLPTTMDDLADILTDSREFEWVDHGSTRLYTGVDGNGQHYVAAMNNSDGGCFVCTSTAAALAPFAASQKD